MKVVVVDASLAIKWVLAEPYTPESRAMLIEWERTGVVRLVPGWFACEVANVLFRRALTGSLTLAQARQGLESLLLAVTTRDVEPSTSLRALEIADRLQKRATYDSQYVALAEHEGCDLWTADERFWRTARAAFPRVRWIGQP